jgi:hypothetical protein
MSLRAGDFVRAFGSNEVEGATTMKRFARILIATAGLAAMSAPAIFARDFHDGDHGRDRRERVVEVRREPVRVFDRAVAVRQGDRFCR